MKFARFILIGIAAVATGYLFNGCSHNIAGATTETTNGATGVLRNSDNTPAKSSIVKLFPASYDPVADALTDTIYTDTTDNAGVFRFSAVTQGEYTIVARNADYSELALLQEILISDSAVTTVEPGILDKPGSLQTGFTVDTDIDSSSYLYLPGTDIYTFISTPDAVHLNNVPPGVLTTILLATASGEKRNIIKTEITLHPEETVTINHPFWQYSRQIGLNTSPSGADISGNIYNFPTLVRLDSTNIDFSQLSPDGADLLFTRGATTVLPFEIEVWDIPARKAAVWVKIDTLFGNNSTQSISMYWGTSAGSAAAPSSSAEVFDTTDGFQGVWHFSDSENGQIKDATLNGYHGAAPDSARPSLSGGIAGNCRNFNGSTNYISMPNTAESKLSFPEDGSYTVSAWVLIDSFDGSSHCIVSKGYQQYYLRSTYISMSMQSATPLWEFVQFGETSKWQTSNYPAVSRQWAHLAGVRQGAVQRLYCNGELVDSTIDEWYNAVSRNTANDLIVGKFAKQITVPINEGYCYFKGGIDEVRIESRAKSPEWVRLCYMNQRPDDRLVAFR